MDNPIGEELRVDAEVLSVLQMGQHRIRKRSDSHLERRAVRNQLGYPFGDLLHHRIAGIRRHPVLVKRRIHFHNVVEVLDVNERVAEDVGHLRVDLGDDSLGGAGTGLRQAGLNAEGAKPVRIGRREVDEGDVDGEHPLFEQQRVFRQQYGRVVRSSIPHRLADIVADEHRVGAQVALQFRRIPGGRADRQRLRDLHVLELRSMGHKCIGERTRDAAVAGQEYA